MRLNLNLSIHSHTIISSLDVSAICQKWLSGVAYYNSPYTSRATRVTASKRSIGTAGRPGGAAVRRAADVCKELASETGHGLSECLTRGVVQGKVGGEVDVEQVHRVVLSDVDAVAWLIVGIDHLHHEHVEPHEVTRRVEDEEHDGNQQQHLGYLAAHIIILHSTMAYNDREVEENFKIIVSTRSDVVSVI